LSVCVELYEVKDDKGRDVIDKDPMSLLCKYGGCGEWFVNGTWRRLVNSNQSDSGDVSNFRNESVYCTCSCSEV